MSSCSILGMLEPGKFVVANKSNVSTLFSDTFHRLFAYDPELEKYTCVINFEFTNFKNIAFFLHSQFEKSSSSKSETHFEKRYSFPICTTANFNKTNVTDTLCCLQ